MMALQASKGSLPVFYRQVVEISTAYIGDALGSKSYVESHIVLCVSKNRVRMV